MSQEIMEGIRTIEREKGIETGTLVAALEDALLAAYKKTPGASRHAEVILDDEGEFRVFSIEIPGDLEERLVEEAREAAIDELERIEEETGERQHTLVNDVDLELDWSQVPEDLMVRADVTPDGFGRIAAMTAKQVIQQRIREAERAMMYDEYIDRQGEVVTGIVQQAGDRNNVLVDLGQRRGAAAALRAGRRRALRAGLADQGRDHRGAVGHEGPAGDPVAPRPGADQDAVRARGSRDRRRSRRDPRRRARAGLPLEDRRRVAHAGRRPGRRLRRPARLAGAHGRVRAARREDRHHPVEHRAGPVRREGALARPRARGLHRRRHARGDRRRPRRPARARDRQGRPQRPAGRAPDGLEGRHPVGHGVRPGRGRGGVRRRGRHAGVLGPLRGDALERQALPERRAARLALLRRARPPGTARHRAAVAMAEARR